MADAWSGPMLVLFVVFLTFLAAGRLVRCCSGRDCRASASVDCWRCPRRRSSRLQVVYPVQTSRLGQAAAVTVLAILYLGWATVLAGSQLAVAARREDPIDSFLQAGRGEQLDFGLRLVRDLEAQTRLRRWARVEDLAASLRAHPAMITFALDRLRRSGLVEFDEEDRRPPRRWGIRDDLEALSLHDLSRAMGTHLEPSPGLHGGAAEDVIEGLAAREQLAQGQNLLSLFRDEGDAALAPGPYLQSPMPLGWRISMLWLVHRCSVQRPSWWTVPPRIMADRWRRAWLYLRRCWENRSVWGSRPWSRCRRGAGLDPGHASAG